MTEIDENVIGETLTAKQEAFCRFYTQIGATFGNATLSYAEAYGVDLESYSDEKEVLAENEDGEPIEWGDSPRSVVANRCASAGSRLLRNVKVDKRVRELLNEMMTTEVIDARLVEIIMKGKDTDAIQAIKEFNKLKQRIIEKKDITSGGEKIAGFNFVRADEPKLPEFSFKDATKTEAEKVYPIHIIPEPNIVKP